MILAVDPGNTTGWATLTDTGEFYCGQIPGRYNFYSWFWDDLEFNGLYAIATEKYTITPDTARMSAQYDALYINGFLDGFSYDKEIEFVMQTPSKAKRFMTDKHLKAAGWWRPGTGYEHAMDAARHLGLYVVDSHHSYAPKLMEEILGA